MSVTRIGRRTFLRGASAASLALPLLPALDVDAQNGVYPKRLVVWWVPESMSRNWRPSGASDLTAPLAPLQRHRGRVSVLKGFHNGVSHDWLNGRGFFDLHGTGPVTMLTGGHGPSRRANGVDIPSGQSIDQIVARVVGQGAPRDSYEIGARNRAGQYDTPDKSQISFNNRDAPRNPEPNPVTTFNALLSGAPTTGGGPAPAGPDDGPLRTRLQLLDSVRDEIRSLRCELDSESRYKLDAHVESVNAIRRQIEGSVGGGSTTPMPPTTAVPTVDVPSGLGNSSAYNSVDRFPQVLDVQSQIAVAALAAGVTQVLTMHWGNTNNQLRYPFVSGMNFPNASHHDLSHSCCQGPAQGNSSRGYSDLEPIYRWYFEQLATFLDRLEAIPEGNGTMLDNTLVFYCSEFGDPDHGRDGGHRNVPFLIAGMGDRFRLGQNFDGGGRNHNDLLAAVVQGMGVDLGEVGEGGYNRGAFTEILR